METRDVQDWAPLLPLELGLPFLGADLGLPTVVTFSVQPWGQLQLMRAMERHWFAVTWPLLILGIHMLLAGLIHLGKPVPRLHQRTQLSENHVNYSRNVTAVS